MPRGQSGRTRRHRSRRSGAGRPPHCPGPGTPGHRASPGRPAPLGNRARSCLSRNPTIPHMSLSLPAGDLGERSRGSDHFSSFPVNCRQQLFLESLPGPARPLPGENALAKERSPMSPVRGQAHCPRRSVSSRWDHLPPDSVRRHPRRGQGQARPEQGPALGGPDRSGLRGAGPSGASGQGPHSHDMCARIDLETYTPCPTSWESPASPLTSTSMTPPTRIVRGSISAGSWGTRELGFVFNVGIEPEFFLVTKQADGSIRGWDPHGVDDLRKPCYDFEAIAALEFSSRHERGPRGPGLGCSSDRSRRRQLPIRDQLQICRGSPPPTDSPSSG